MQNSFGLLYFRNSNLLNELKYFLLLIFLVKITKVFYKIKYIIWLILKNNAAVVM